MKNRIRPLFLFRLVEGRWVFKELNGKELVANFLRKYNNRKMWIELTFKVHRQPKTLPQLGYYYAAILPTIHQQLLDNGYTMKVMDIEIPIDEDATDKLIKYFCGRITPAGVIITAREYPTGPIIRKRDLSKVQCMQFIDSCIAWAKEALNCNIPPPTYKSDKGEDFAFATADIGEDEFEEVKE